jgi:hypothetical protein
VMRWVKHCFRSLCLVARDFLELIPLAGVTLLARAGRGPGNGKSEEHSNS